MSPRITGISSMATRALLADLARACEQQTGIAVAIESVGGVDAAKRVEAGERFDVVFLASDAIDRLIASGHVAGPRVDLVRSPVAIAVRAGAPRPDVSTEAALEAAVLAAARISHSTGPSGVHLRKLFERWGIAAEIAPRIVQAPPGVPVGSLVARGEVDLGFQQLSELMSLPGIAVIGGLPGDTQFITTFSAGVCATSAQAEAARAVLAFMASPPTTEPKRRHGMEPA
ncbi:MAG TPA: substrate-binding domain-containing protein [Burkholderiaceae bacterium]|nr:substrate-binding domain-containing protein [Burkholderiaceae bacterium]